MGMVKIKSYVIIISHVVKVRYDGVRFRRRGHVVSSVGNFTFSSACYYPRLSTVLLYRVVHASTDTHLKHEQSAVANGETQRQSTDAAQNRHLLPVGLLGTRTRVVD